jgi:hypothetical protein
MPTMKSVFKVNPGDSLSEHLDIPETQYFLKWNPVDRAYEVRDILGWKHFHLTHQVRRMLRAQNVADTFPMVGKVIQQYAKAFAA